MIPRSCCLAPLLLSLTFGLAAQQGEARQKEEVGGVVLDAEPLQLSQPAPAPKWSRWVRGEPIVFGAAGAPVCTVFAFYAAAEVPLQRDADWLDELQQRFGARGVRCVAVVDAAPVAKALAHSSVVEDEGQRTRARWDVGIGDGRHVVVVDRTGLVLFQGGLDGDVVAAIQAAVDGNFDPARAARAAGLRTWVQGAFDDLGGAEVQQQLDELLEVYPEDGLVWGLAYANAELQIGDRERAAQLRRRALERLGNTSRPLAVFVDFALRCATQPAALAKDFAAALQPATAAAPRDPLVQLAFLRALVLADRGREVGRHAARTARLVQSSAEDCLAFAAILTQASLPQAHRDLGEQAVQRAEALGAPVVVVAPAKYLVARYCAEDAAQAKVVFDAYAEQVGAGSLNDACWYLMTELPSLGRYDRFALALAERMLEQRDTMAFNEFDTAAFAMHRVGRHREAVELQELALQRGGTGTPAYEERLARYREATPPAVGR